MDDESMVREFIARVLEKHGYEVVQAAHGLDGALSAGGCDLVISDVIMPHMNGVELAAYLQHVVRVNKVLLISAFPTPGIVRRPGLLEFLSKPFMPEELIALVRAMLKPRASGAGSETQA